MNAHRQHPLRSMVGLLFVVGLAHPATAAAATGDITTFAGAAASGIGTTVGQEPAAVLAHGSILYVSDQTMSVVRRLDLVTGLETVAAGNGARGFAGDGGPAVAAMLALPYGLAVDPAGNLFIADRLNGRIRRVDATTGVITTVAGGGTTTGDGGPATAAAVHGPLGVAVDPAGNIFLTQQFGALRRVDAGTGIITTLADVGLGFQLATDPAGNLLIAAANRVLRRDAVTGTIGTVAGIAGSAGYFGDGGPATAAGLTRATGVALDTSGNLYIADGGDDSVAPITHNVRRVDAATGIITTIAGGASPGFTPDGALASAALLELPGSVAIDGGGNVLIAERGSRRVRRIDAGTGVLGTVAGNGTEGNAGDGGPAAAAQIPYPSDVVVDGSGNVIVGPHPFSRTRNHQVRRIDAGTGTISTVAGTGPPGFAGDGGDATLALLHYPRGYAIDTAGNLFIADSHNHRIRRVDAATGIISTVAGTGTAGFSGDGGSAAAAQLTYPEALAIDPGDNLLVADTGNGRVRRIDASSGVITTYAGGGSSIADGVAATAASISPNDLELDAAGNLFLAEWRRVRRVDAATQTITTVAGGGGLLLSDGGPATSAELRGDLRIALDPAGNLLISEEGRSGGYRVRRVDAATGVIATVAGPPTPGGGFAGDGGAALAATFTSLAGIAVAADGSLLVADTFANRVRRIEGMATCGDGTLDAGEACDAGAANGTAGECCKAICRPVDFDGDGVCDGDDRCVNRDGARTFDATRSPRPKLTLARIAAEPVVGNDTLGLDGAFRTNPFDAPSARFEPIARDATRLVLQNAAGAVRLDVTLPSGAYAGRGTRGWKLRPTQPLRESWTYSDTTGAPLGGITKATVSYEHRTNSPGLLRVSLRGKNGDYPVVVGDEPVRAIVTLGDQAKGEAGYCGETGFVAGACRFNASSRTLVCR